MPTWRLTLQPSWFNTFPVAADSDGRDAAGAGTPSRPTPADIRLANENERMRATREAIEKDPNVRALQEQLGATLEADSIRPTK